MTSEPGVYDLSLADYHADPVPAGSLSVSGAKTLLTKTPALFAYERDHGRPDKAVFDFGHAAHDAVLGGGPEIVPVDAHDWRTKAAKEARDEARARGAVPILRDEWFVVQGMAEALKAHPAAGTLLSPDRGTPEKSLIWRDDDAGVWRRARFDMLPHPGPGRMLIADYKSTTDASPRAFAAAVAKFGYHMQDDWYTEAARALGLADDAAFLLVAQEKTPPYLVAVYELTEAARRIGRERNARALDIFRTCTDTGVWPGYGDAPQTLELPRWAEIQHQEDLIAS